MWAVVVIPEFWEWLEESEHIALNALAKISYGLLSSSLTRRVAQRRILQFYALEEWSRPPISESHSDPRCQDLLAPAVIMEARANSRNDSGSRRITSGAVERQSAL